MSMGTAIAALVDSTVGIFAPRRALERRAARAASEQFGASFRGARQNRLQQGWYDDCPPRPATPIHIPMTWIEGFATIDACGQDAEREEPDGRFCVRSISGDSQLGQGEIRVEPHAQLAPRLAPLTRMSEIQAVLREALHQLRDHFAREDES